MAKTKKRENTQPSLKTDWRHLVTAGALLLAVVGSLVLGAALESDTPPGVTVIEAGRPMPEAVSGPPETPEFPDPDSGLLDPNATREPSGSRPLPLPEGNTVTQRLARRAGEDLQRLAAGPDWTLQFHYGCDAGQVDALMSRLVGTADLYLLPVLDGDEACFRVCWGQFSTPDAARAARRIPASLRSMTVKPLPKRVADLVP